MPVRFLFFILVSCCFLLQSCAGKEVTEDEQIALERKLYEPYELKDTIEGYKEFISSNPGSFWTNAARKRISDLEYAEYEKKDTLKGYLEFTNEYPDNPNVHRARRNIERLELRNCEKEDTISIFQDFLEKYPRSVYSYDAKKRIQELEFRQFDKELNEKYGFDLLLYRLNLRRLKKKLFEGKHSLGDFICFASFVTVDNRKYFHTHLMYPEKFIPSKIASGELSDEFFNNILAKELAYLNSKFKKKKKIAGFSFDLATSMLGLYKDRKVWAEYYFPLDKVGLFATGRLDRKALLEKSRVIIHEKTANREP